MGKVYVVIQRDVLELVHAQLEYDQIFIAFELDIHQFVVVGIEMRQQPKGRYVEGFQLVIPQVYLFKIAQHHKRAIQILQVDRRKMECPYYTFYILASFILG